MSPTYVNFGCGVCTSSDMLNVDGSYTVLFARLPIPLAWYGQRKEFVQAFREGRVRYANARTLRFAPRALDGFYTSHTLEHLSRGDCLTLIDRIRGFLKPGGIFRVSLPDLRLIVRDYAEERIDADEFVKRTMLSFGGSSLRQRLMSREFHRWMYDADSFESLLRSSGFSGIVRCEVGQSRLAEFATLDRQIDQRFNRARESFYIEACSV
jgi:predicted SAM-dependent methyltransferase